MASVIRPTKAQQRIIDIIRQGRVLRYWKVLESWSLHLGTGHAPIGVDGKVVEKMIERGYLRKVRGSVHSETYDLVSFENDDRNKWQDGG